MTNVTKGVNFSYACYEKYDNKLDVSFEFSVEDFETWLTWGDALLLEWIEGNEMKERVMSIEEYWAQDREVIDEDVKNFALYTIQKSSK